MGLVGSICCIIYYVTASIAEIPAIVRVIKRKQSMDYSITAILLYLTSAISWSIYIYTTKQNMVVYVGTFIDLVICIVYSIVMIKYHNK